MAEQTRIAEVNGAKLVYEMAGEGRALVLIHSSFCDQRMSHFVSLEYIPLFGEVRERVGRMLPGARGDLRENDARHVERG